MYTGLVMGHILVIVGCVLIAWNLTGWYMKLLSAAQGSVPARKPRFYDGLGIISGLLLIAGGVCYIIHWVIDYRLLG